MHVKYLGPSPSVDIVIPGGSIPAKRGESVEVPDDIGASLCEQDTFEPVGAKPRATSEEHD